MSCRVTRRLLTTLQVGEMWYRIGQEKHYLHVAFGFVEVLPDRVTVLAQMAESAEEIDVERAEAAKRRAEERIATPTADLDFERARIALMKSLIRLQVASRAQHAGLIRWAGNLDLICWPTSARLVGYRALIQSLVVRDLKARYRGSVLGFLWSFVNPLLLLLVYSFVFLVMPTTRGAYAENATTRCSCSAVCCRGHGSRRRCSKRPRYSSPAAISFARCSFLRKCCRW